MPSLFDDHYAKLAVMRIAAVKDDTAISVADAKLLHAKLGGLLKAHEAATSSSALRAAKLDKALNDPARQPAIQYAKGALRRLGLDFAAAADINALTTAMRERDLDVTSRIELKRVLSDLGLLD